MILLSTFTAATFENYHLYFQLSDWLKILRLDLNNWVTRDLAGRKCHVDPGRNFGHRLLYNIISKGLFHLLRIYTVTWSKFRHIVTNCRALPSHMRHT